MGIRVSGVSVLRTTVPKKRDKLCLSTHSLDMYLDYVGN